MGTQLATMALSCCLSRTCVLVGAEQRDQKVSGVALWAGLVLGLGLTCSW